MTPFQQIQSEYQKLEGIKKDFFPLVQNTTEKLAEAKKTYEQDNRIAKREHENNNQIAKKTYEQGNQKAKENYENSNQKAKQEYENNNQIAKKTYEQDNRKAKEEYEQGNQKAKQEYEQGNQKAKQEYENNNQIAKDVYDKKESSVDIKKGIKSIENKEDIQKLKRKILIRNTAGILSVFTTITSLYFGGSYGVNSFLFGVPFLLGIIGVLFWFVVIENIADYKMVIIRKENKRLYEVHKQNIENQYQTQKQQIENTYQSTTNRLKNTFQTQKQQIEKTYQSTTNRLKTTFQTQKQQIETTYQSTINRLKTTFQTQKQQIENTYQTQKQQIEKIYQSTKNQLESDLKNTFTRWRQVAEEAESTYFKPYPETYSLSKNSWNEVLNKDRKIPLSYMRLGNVNLVSHSHTLKIPFLLPFLNEGNILFKGRGNQTLQAASEMTYGILARLLLALPSGKVKFTFIDPVGLGRNISPFLALHEDLYGKKVWTESNHIEEQLTKTTRHMENVIQKYLRNEYADMAAYNLAAEEVEEPYRILVIYNFPVNFSDSACAKLKSIMQNGAKTGVHTLLVVDDDKKMPYGFNLRELTDLSKNLVFDQSMTLSNYPKTTTFQKETGDLPFADIVKHVNKGFASLDTVKVPFEKYLPAPEDWWSGKAQLDPNSQKQFDFYEAFGVTIGKKGARDEQVFYFDNRDKAHALLVGRSGSGKSNLLHILITNVLLNYSPDQLELYLVDFKEGVEFVIYAENQIPHAKTIAIESEREFGLSVLQGLEKELLERGNTFRNKRVNSLIDMHEKYPSTRMPRILLIIDEFQVFFNEDDRISQSALKIFDNLVRKGRAYGINILLATQSLSGNLTSFKGLMHSIAVRVALMCSDSDSRTILSDDNPDAKLLTRPGEGIYNAMGGLVEGNNRFQTFFMDSKKHESYIQKVRDFAQAQNYTRKDKQIIFRGDSASFIEANEALNQLEPLAKPKRLMVWLGEPVTIDDDVCAILRKQSGSHLLIVGLDEELSSYIVLSALVSLALQHQAHSAEFIVLNFLNIDEDIFQYPKTYFANAPFKVSHGKNKNVKAYLESLKEEVERRLDDESTGDSNIYLTLLATQRGRKFRKIDGYTLSEEGELLSYILKEGADVGVFVIMHVDNLNNMGRCFDDAIRNEFSQRIALQMSADDSTNLIDSDIASKLGPDRAYYYDETEGILKKFKPYTKPNLMWFENLLAQR